MVISKNIFSFILFLLVFNTSTHAGKASPSLVPIINYLLMDSEDNHIKQFNGTWEGLGLQTNGSEWTIEVKIDSNTKKYTIKYPSLSCGGILTFKSSSLNKVEFYEKITYGTSQCIDGGITSLEKTSQDKANFYWYKSTSNQKAFGELERTD